MRLFVPVTIIIWKPGEIDIYYRSNDYLLIGAGSER